MTLLAEDVLLLLLDDESGRLTLSGTGPDTVLGGSLLLELALADRVGVRKDGGLFRQERVVVLDPTPLGDELLDEALRTVAEKERSPQDLVSRLGKGLRARLLARLTARGLVRREADTVLGLFPRERWPAEDSRHEDEVRARLHAVLVTGLTADERTSALVALLSAVDQAHKVPVGLDSRQRREVRARAKQVAQGEWAATAVRKAVEAMQAAVVAAAATTVVVAGSS